MSISLINMDLRREKPKLESARVFVGGRRCSLSVLFNFPEALSFRMSCFLVLNRLAPELLISE